MAGRSPSSEKLPATRRTNQFLATPFGETSTDGMFTLEGSRCLGTCGLAPVIMIDNQTYGRLTPQSVRRILKKFRRAARSQGTTHG